MTTTDPTTERLEALERAVDEAQTVEAFSRAVRAVEAFIAALPAEWWERVAEEEGEA